MDGAPSFRDRQDGGLSFMVHPAEGAAALPESPGWLGECSSIRLHVS